MYRLGLVGLLGATLAQMSSAANTTLTKLVCIPSQDTVQILPSFVGNVSEGFVDTQTNNKTITALLKQAKSAAFISYDPEFLEIFGENPAAVLIQQRNTDFAFEAAVWVYDRNEVWFTSNVETTPIGQSTKIYRYNVIQNNVTMVTPSITVTNPNGGYYFHGLVYITAGGDNTTAPSIVTIDPMTYETKVVVNSYFGLALNFIDDVTVVPANHDGNGIDTPHIYFSSVNYGAFVGRPQNQVPNAVWRFTPSTQALVPVISRADIRGPNGVRVNVNGTKLYVGEFDSVAAASFAGDDNLPGSPAIFEFDLDSRGFPINKRLFGIAREGAPDGIHLDDYGRVWTGEGEGVVIRNNVGKIIGLLNVDAFRESNITQPIAQFALAGDVVVVLALNRLWRIQLKQTIVRPGNFGN